MAAVALLDRGRVDTGGASRAADLAAREARCRSQYVLVSDDVSEQSF